MCGAAAWELGSLAVLCWQCLEMAMQCSAKTMIKGLHSVFVYACKMVEYPVPPLYDVHTAVRLLPAVLRLASAGPLCSLSSSQSRHRTPETEPWVREGHETHLPAV